MWAAKAEAGMAVAVKEAVAMVRAAVVARAEAARAAEARAMGAWAGAVRAVEVAVAVGREVVAWAEVEEARVAVGIGHRNRSNRDRMEVY